MSTIPARVPIGQRCVYCKAAGQPLTGDGYRKRCANESECAARVAQAQPVQPGTRSPLRALGSDIPGRAAASGPWTTQGGTTAQALIELMRERAGFDQVLQGPLQLGVDTFLPLVAAQARYVAFGKPESGKSNLTAVKAECYFPHLPICVFDFLGNLHGLRMPGSGPGIPIPIIGGAHADLSLAPTDAVKLAGIFSAGHSMLIDLSLLTREDQQWFMADWFTESLRTLRIPAHVIIEEAETPAPSFSRSKAAFAAQAAGTLWARQIRNFGVGWTMSTQRVKHLHPDVIDASSVFLALNTTGDAAQQTIGKEAKSRVGKMIATAIINELGQLPRGEAWVIPDPSWLGGSASAPFRLGIRPRHTFDSTKVPAIGEPPQRAPEPVAVDLRPFAVLRDEDGDAGEPVKKNRDARRSNKWRT